MLKECAVEAWQRRWDNDELGRHRYEVDPILRPRTVEMRRREEVLWNRLRLGVARLAKWRQTVLQEGDGLCTGCGEEDETMVHVLIECRTWRESRNRMWNELGVTRPEERTLKKLLGQDECSDGSASRRVKTIRSFLDRIELREWFIMC